MTPEEWGQEPTDTEDDDSGDEQILINIQNLNL